LERVSDTPAGPLMRFRYILYQKRERSWRGDVKRRLTGEFTMNNIIYIIGLVVVVIAILSFLGLR
jgi:small-conductance mechanosensitive channel